MVLNRNKGGIVYRRREESVLCAGEMGTAECGLCERSQTAHLTPLRVTNFCEDYIIVVDQVDYSTETRGETHAIYVHK